MVTPRTAREIVARHMLVDGFDLVLDTRESRGSTLVDARDGTRYLDLFTFFASSALGMNPPRLTHPQVLDELGRVAVNKPSNSDLVTVELAEFVEVFQRVLGDPDLPHLFLIDGGALAVENALKVAFDWKSRRNEAAGRDPGLGTKVVHLEGAFHGRSGYTMSLTNTDPTKTSRFPRFDWPRIPAPAFRYPADDAVDEAREAERRALAAAEAAFTAHPHDIACVIVEPIQGEGGDRHLRAEFLQSLQSLAHAHDALFVLDEVQTGCGITGSAWAYQQLGLAPDVVAFGKKVQVCGVMAGRRVDEVPDNVFEVPSRVNSTWGGNLTDIVRATHVLRQIEEGDLITAATRLGKVLLEELHALADRHGEVSGVRGRGLMCAIDLPDTRRRDAVLASLFADERVLLLGSGTRSIRFRPALTVTPEELASGVAALDRVLTRAT